MKALYSAAFIAVTISLVSCQKEAEADILAPIVQTGEASDISRTSAVLSGSVNANGTVSENHGIVYSLYPTMEQAKEIAANGTKTDGSLFRVQAANLEPGRTYYFRTYSSSGYNKAYGEVRNFQTPSVSGPAFSATSYSDLTITNVTVNTSVIDNGGSDLLVQGVIYSEYSGGSTNITYGAPGVTTVQGELDGNNLSVTLHDLTPGKEYVIRPYGVSNGIGYGLPIQVRTVSSEIPVVSSLDSTAVTSSSITVSAKVLSEGKGVTISERGFCYSANAPEPTFEDTPGIRSVTLRSGEEFKKQITGLSTNTDYYIRAYMRTSAGKYVYGEVLKHNFSESIVPVEPSVEVKTISASNVTSSSATFHGFYRATNIEVKEAYFVYMSLYGYDEKIKECEVTSDFVSATVTGLDYNSSYICRFVVIDEAGNKHEGDPIEFQTAEPTIYPSLSVTTMPASDITSTSATLYAFYEAVKMSVNEAYFVYGKSSESQEYTVKASTNNPMTATITGLEPNTEYYYYIVVHGPYEERHGEIVTFRTTQTKPGEGDINYPTY